MQNYDAGKRGEFLSVFTDTVELTYAQAAEAHVAAHPVWARRAPRIVSSSSDIGVLQASRGDGAPSLAEARMEGAGAVLPRKADWAPQARFLRSATSSAEEKAAEEARPARDNVVAFASRRH